jgi:multidrug efflux pump subunit AcrA (membrane-fusion protein)
LLDQIDVVNVQPGMKVQVVLDAYPWEIFEWVLGDIDSTPTTTNGVVSYTVKVSIDKWTKIMYSWMTASVKIIVENKENVLVIPTTYIQSQWDIKYVLNKNSNQINIEVGATDGTITEVVSWLTEGMIITKIIKANSISSASNSFRVPGMGAWGMWWWRPD